MKKKLFFKNIIIMSVSSLLIRSIGMFFTIRIAAVMGTEMLGRYRLVISIYAFFLLICTSGVSVTVTRITGELLAKEEYGKASYVRDRWLLISFVAGLILFSIMSAASFILPSDFFGEGAVSSFRILGVSLPFASCSAALRGYFTAKRKPKFLIKAKTRINSKF